MPVRHIILVDALQRGIVPRNNGITILVAIPIADVDIIGKADGSFWRYIKINTTADVLTFKVKALIGRLILSLCAIWQVSGFINCTISNTIALAITVIGINVNFFVLVGNVKRAVIGMLCTS